MKRLIITTLICVVMVGCKSGSAPSGESSQVGASKIVGKWQRTYQDQILGQDVGTLEFFASGDFSESILQVHSNMRVTNAGKYTFIDPTHLKLDYGIEAKIYEVVGITDKELRLKQQEGLEIWNRI